MKYVVNVWTVIEVDAENEKEALEKASDELREMKPKEFSMDVSPKGGKQ